MEGRDDTRKDERDDGGVCEDRRSSKMRSDSRFLSAGLSTPSASRSDGASLRKVGGDMSAAAKRGANLDKPASRSQAVTCASASTIGLIEVEQAMERCVVVQIAMTCAKRVVTLTNAQFENLDA